jgi:hypothetical protein
MQANLSSSTDLVATLAEGFISEHAHDDKPFFLYLPFQNIHEPLDCSEESFGRFAGLDGLPDEGKIIFG